MISSSRQIIFSKIAAYLNFGFYVANHGPIIKHAFSQKMQMA